MAISRWRRNKGERVSIAMWASNGALHTRYDRNNFAGAARDPSLFEFVYGSHIMLLATDQSFYFDNRALALATESDNHVTMK